MDMDSLFLNYAATTSPPRLVEIEWDPLIGLPTPNPDPGNLPLFLLSPPLPYMNNPQEGLTALELISPISYQGSSSQDSAEGDKNFIWPELGFIDAGTFPENADLIEQTISSGEDYHSPWSNTVVDTNQSDAVQPTLLIPSVDALSQTASSLLDASSTSISQDIDALLSISYEGDASTWPLYQYYNNTEAKKQLQLSEIEEPSMILSINSDNAVILSSKPSLVPVAVPLLSSEIATQFQVKQKKLFSVPTGNIASLSTDSCNGQWSAGLDNHDLRSVALGYDLQSSQLPINLLDVANQVEHSQATMAIQQLREGQRNPWDAFNDPPKAKSTATTPIQSSSSITIQNNSISTCCLLDEYSDGIASTNGIYTPPCNQLEAWMLVNSLHREAPQTLPLLQLTPQAQDLVHLSDQSRNPVLHPSPLREPNGPYTQSFPCQHHMSSHPWTKTYLQCHHQQQPQAFNLYPQSYCTQHYPQYYSSEELSEAIQNGQHFHHHSSPQAAFKGEKEYHFTPVLSTLKRRRRLTNEESEFLIHQFKINERPTAQERESFAKYLKLDRRTIQVWFQNRRAKLKRDEKGGEESAGEDQ